MKQNKNKISIFLYRKVCDKQELNASILIVTICFVSRRNETISNGFNLWPSLSLDDATWS